MKTELLKRKKMYVPGFFYMFAGDVDLALVFLERVVFSEIRLFSNSFFKVFNGNGTLPKSTHKSCLISEKLSII